MDNCHARDQCTSDIAGHGKNYFDGENIEKRGNISYWRRSSPERKSGTVRGCFSEACRYFLWNAI